MKVRHEIRRMSQRFRRFLRSDEAVSALEYAMLVGIIAIAVGAAVVTFSGDYKAPITKVAGKVGAITTQAIKVTP